MRNRFLEEAVGSERQESIQEARNECGVWSTCVVCGARVCHEAGRMDGERE